MRLGDRIGGFPCPILAKSHRILSVPESCAQMRAGPLYNHMVLYYIHSRSLHIPMPYRSSPLAVVLLAAQFVLLTVFCEKGFRALPHQAFLADSSIGPCIESGSHRLMPAFVPSLPVYGIPAGHTQASRAGSLLAPRGAPRPIWPQELRSIDCADPPKCAIDTDGTNR